MKYPDLLHVGTYSWKLKVDREILGWMCLKNGCCHSGHRALKLALSQEEIME